MILKNQRGIGLVAILVVVGILGLSAAGVATAIYLLQEPVHPSEQTARFLPDNTEIYYSLNMRPGGDQRRFFADILASFQSHTEFQPQIDDLYDKIETETGIDLVAEALPLLGPEVAVGW
jgi:hypothetical protein